MVDNNELYLQAKQGKAPFIGVFQNFGTHNYTEIVRDLKDDPMDVFVYVGESLMIELRIGTDNYLRKYSSVRYNREMLMGWLYHAKDAAEIYFGHVAYKNGAVHVQRSHAGDVPIYRKINTLYVIFEKKDDRVLRVVGV